MAGHTTSSMSVVEKACGTHRFKIIGYNQNLYSFPIRSGRFNIGGHDWQLVYYPRSHNHDDVIEAEYIEVILELLSADTQVTATVDLRFINQTTNDPCHATLHRVLTLTSEWESTIKVMKMSDLEKLANVQDNSIIIECELTMVLQPKELETKSLINIEVPPSEMVQQFGMLLGDMETADVTFDVGGESFHAHRLLLAVRSPVFKAQLFGSMSDTRMQCLAIPEMKPSVFKALLHYIYTETTPDDMDVADRCSRHEMLCHLLQAADRYAIERLKTICERMLWLDLDVENVAMTLALAEQHHCKQLTDSCLEFMEPPEKMDAVVATQGYNELKRDYPSLLFKVWERRVRHHTSKG